MPARVCVRAGTELIYGGTKKNKTTRRRTNREVDTQPHNIRRRRMINLEENTTEKVTGGYNDHETEAPNTLEGHNHSPTRP